jgi:hypothetical protein
MLHAEHLLPVTEAKTNFLLVRRERASNLLNNAFD